MTTDLHADLHAGPFGRERAAFRMAVAAPQTPPRRRTDDLCPICGYPGGSAQDHRDLTVARPRRVIELGTGR